MDAGREWDCNVKSKECRLELEKLRALRINSFKQRMPIADPAARLCGGLVKAGLDVNQAEEMANDVEEIVDWYWRAVVGEERYRTPQDKLARELHQLAKKAVMHLDRRKPPPEHVIEKIAKGIDKLNALKYPTANEFVSPVMRFGITEETVRMATGRRPRSCQRCRPGNQSQAAFCSCMIWPEGDANTIDPFDKFDFPRVPKQSSLDPREYEWRGAASLLRLYKARFNPTAWPNKKGPPEPPFDQDLVDNLSSSYEDITGKVARTSSNSWNAIFGAIVEFYGLDFLNLTITRTKRWETYRDYQWSTYGFLYLPRGVRDPAPKTRPQSGRVVTEAVKRRDRAVHAQLMRLRLECELFMGQL